MEKTGVLANVSFSSICFFIQTIILVPSTSTLQFNWHCILLFKRYSNIFKRCYNKPYKSYTLLSVYNTALPDLTLVCQITSYASKKARKMALRSSIKCELLCYTVTIRKSLGLDGKEVLYGTLFLFKFKMPPPPPPKKKKQTQLRFQILIACRETVSLPEQVKQKENLCDHNIQLKNLN